MMFKSFKDRIKDNELLSVGLIQLLLIISIVVESYGLFSKVLGSNDANFYSSIAKHIATSNDWVNLYYAGMDWLDKPHFPFWLTALSFKLFGINTFAYILPGFLFHLLGGYYTYRLGAYLYTKQVGLLSALFYFTSLHLMLSAIDVRAEAFLLGEITPAIYYLLMYKNNDGINYKYLIKSSVFIALALMTKGIFTIITIYGGIFAIYLYDKEFKNLVSRKWLYSIGLSLIFILPELICLFLQFDLHPEKIVFGKTGVSGLKFFFWDSQFGRFFDFGPYVSSGDAGYSHYFYFIHTFMWSFLPWTMIFFVSCYYLIGQLRLNNDNLQVRQQKINIIFLLATFFITFVLFSLTKFQLDHYTNIIIPFASIICANWVYNQATRITKHWLFTFQIYISLILISLVIFFSFLTLPIVGLFEISILILIIIVLYMLFIKNRILNKAIVYSCLAINLVFIFTQMVNNKVYVNYDIGYQISRFLLDKPTYPVLDYKVNSSSLDFHLNTPYRRVSDVSDKSINMSDTSYFVVVPEDLESSIPGGKVIKRFDSIDQNKFIPLLINHNKLNANVREVSLILVNNKESDTKTTTLVPSRKNK